MYSKLTVTDGTERISFLTPDTSAGLNIESWRPGIAEYKGGGTWQDSPIADGRQLAYTQWANTVESWGFKAWADDADDLIRIMQDLKRLLIKGVQYWTTSWQTEPVWIEALSPCETYTRYALIRWWALPEEEFPYGGVFYQATGGAAMDNLTLMLEHLHWTDTVPGVGTATAISAEQDFCYPWYLVCDGDTQSVNCGSDAGLDDLPDNAVAGKGQITVDGWIRADSYGEGNNAQIMGKPGFGNWSFHVLNTVGLRCAISCAAQNAISESGLDEFAADGGWHHVLMTYDETGAGTPAARTIYLAIDGVWVTSYVTQQASIGNYVTDAAASLFIANNNAGTRGFDGGIGWQRVSDNVRYNPAGGNFTPPPQCTFPASDANTLALWIREGTGTAIDNAEGTAARDGTAANNAWDCDCENTFGRAATTVADEVFIANKHNLAQITNIHIYDGVAGAWDGINYVNTNNHRLTINAAGSSIYYGIDTSAVNSGPFCSLVFDNSAAAGATSVWEYWNGAAWVALTVQDNTNADGAGTGQPFDTTGVRSVHWVQPANWTAVSLVAAVGAGSPAFTAYWVRLRITGVGGAEGSQQNRPVYTIVWPYVDVDEAQVPGDIPALLRAQMRNQADHDLSNAPALFATRTIVGTRSISRGADFVAFLNASDTQTDGYTVEIFAGASAFGSDVQTPTGRKVIATNVLAGWIDLAVFIFTPAEAVHFSGTYHAFIRGYQTSGVVGDLQLRLSVVCAGLGSPPIVTQGAAFPNTNDFAVVDMGQVQLFSSTAQKPTELGELRIYIEGDGDGAVDADIYDLILIPVDEWAGDFSTDEAVSNSALGGRSLLVGTQINTLLDVDGIIYAGYRRAIARRVYDNDYIQAIYKYCSPSEPMIQQGADQRLWFFNLRVTGNAPFEIANSLEVQRQARYLGQRGGALT